MPCATPGTISQRCARPWAAERRRSVGSVASERRRRPGGPAPLPDLADPPRVPDVGERVRAQAHEVRAHPGRERAPLALDAERSRRRLRRRRGSPRAGRDRPSRRDRARSRPRGPGRPTCRCPARPGFRPHGACGGSPGAWEVCRAGSRSWGTSPHSRGRTPARGTGPESSRGRPSAAAGSDSTASRKLRVSARNSKMSIVGM